MPTQRNDLNQPYDRGRIGPNWEAQSASQNEMEFTVSMMFPFDQSKSRLTWANSSKQQALAIQHYISSQSTSVVESNQAEGRRRPCLCPSIERPCNRHR